MGVPNKVAAWRLPINSEDELVMHWPVAFKPGKKLFPRDPKNPDWVEFDRTVSLEQTYRKLLELKNEKVGHFNTIKVKWLTCCDRAPTANRRC